MTGWFSDTTTIYVYTWGFILYLIVVAAALVMIAWLGYKKGHSNGYRAGYRQAKLDLDKTETPTRFRQRTAETDPRRHAMVRTARMVARRQPKPEPRRGTPTE